MYNNTNTNVVYIIKEFYPKVCNKGYYRDVFVFLLIRKHLCIEVRNPIKQYSKHPKILANSSNNGSQEIDLITQAPVPRRKRKMAKNNGQQIIDTQYANDGVIATSTEISRKQENNKPVRTLNVVAGLILDKNNEKILLAQRPPNKRHALQWEFPGGKLNRGESLQEAIVRELDEEIGIQIQIEDVHAITFSAYVTPGSDKPVNILICLFHIKKYEGEPYGKEGQQIQWCDIDKLDEVDMPPGDLLFFDVLKIYLKSPK